MSLTVGSLFSGIGLLDCGLEQSGLETIWQVECDDWAREMLNQNFPNTEKFKDVREVGKHNLKQVDIICGGFPCQDISIANTNGLGLEGERSGLWGEYKRIICELRPRYALIENVANLAFRGLTRVMSDLASIGYDAEWQVIQAGSFGLPHKRERLFIISYPAIKRPFQLQIFKRVNIESNIKQKATAFEQYFNFNGNIYPKLPKHLCMDDGRTFELSEIERAVKGYGNGVAVPVAKWIGERIIEFDKASENSPA